MGIVTQFAAVFMSTVTTTPVFRYKVKFIDKITTITEPSQSADIISDKSQMSGEKVDVKHTQRRACFMTRMEKLIDMKTFCAAKSTSTICLIFIVMA